MKKLQEKIPVKKPYYLPVFSCDSLSRHQSISEIQSLRNCFQIGLLFLNVSSKFFFHHLCYFFTSVLTLFVLFVQPQVFSRVCLFSIFLLSVFSIFLSHLNKKVTLPYFGSIDRSKIVLFSPFSSSC